MKGSTYTLSMFALLPAALLAMGSAGAGASLNEGIVCLRAGDVAGAVRALEAVLDSAPEDLAARYWLGRAQLQAGQAEASVAHLRQVVEREPDSGDAHYWLAMALLARGQTAEARAELHAALAADPRNEAAHEALMRLPAAPDQLAPAYRGPVPPPFRGGTRVFLDPGGLAVDPGAVDLLSSHVADYTFSNAPTDWFAGSGVWAITSRWQCSPQWSWEGGHADDGVAVLWNKRVLVGDVTVEAYVSFKMGLGSLQSYRNPNDINITIHGDGQNPSSGYSFMVGAERNTETRIMRGTRTLVATTDPRALLPIFEDGFPSTYEFHRKWWSVRARKRGQLLQLYLDDKLVAQATDPDPLPGGHVGLWTYDNGIIISRVKLYYQGESPRRDVPPGMERIQAPVTTVAKPALSISSGTHPALQNDFEAETGKCEPRGDQPVAQVSLAPGGPSGSGHCLAVTNLAPGGTFAVNLWPDSFNVSQYPWLSFDYRLPADGSVKANLYLTVGGETCEIIFTGPSGGSPGARRIGAVADVRADGEWHHARFDLLNALRIHMPDLGATDVSDLWIGNLNETGYLLAGFGGNPFGATYYLDNLVLDRPGPRKVALAVAGRQEQPRGYAVTLDQFPASEAPTEVTSKEASVTLEAAGEGTWYAHVRALLASGEWTPTQHYRVRVDETPPALEVSSVEPGGTLPDGPVVLSVADPGGSGVDVTSLAPTVNGTPLPLDGVSASYDPSTGILTLDPRQALMEVTDGEEVRLTVGPLADLAGNTTAAPQEFVYRVAFDGDTTAPAPPSVIIGRDGYLVDESFETSVGEFAGYGGASAAAVSLDESTAASGRRSLRVYNRQAAGAFGIYVRKRPFDAGRYRIVAFDYKVPPRLRVDLAVFVNGFWKAIRFKDTDNNLTVVGAVPNVRDDNQWHHAEINLYEMLRRDDPRAASYIVRQFVIADWNWKANVKGQTYHLDNFQIIPVLSGSGGLPLKWWEPDVSGISGLSWIIGPDPNAAVPQQVMATGPAGIIESPGDADGFLRARVRDGAGNWSEPSTRRVVLDSQAPIATPVSPDNGSQAATSVVELSVVDRGIAGIDPASLVLSVAGTDYTLENRGLSYDASTGKLQWNCEQVSPQPVVLPDKSAVPVVLKAAADYAGNPVANPPAWTWTMDYSLDKNAPAVERVQSGTHDTILTNTFEEDLDGWTGLGGGSGAQVERDETTAASGKACVKLTQQKTGGTMAAYVTRTPFAAEKYPIMRFDYRLAKGVKLDFVFHMADGNEYVIAFTDNPTGAVGTIPNVVADDQWHHASVDLPAVLRQKQERGSLQVAYIYLTDRNNMENPAGAVARFDNLMIGNIGQTAPVIRWRATDTTGIVGYSFALDQEPATIPPAAVQTAARSYRHAGALKAGLWFFHVRALDGAGNWGPTTHYGIMHQSPE